jgi:hypothetical protein
MVKFVKENSHTNIVIMEAPQRHDLSTLSCVNNEDDEDPQQYENFRCGYKSGVFHSPWVAYEWNEKGKDGKENIGGCQKIVTRKKHPLSWYGRTSLWNISETK